jgi:hypothetical protein
MRTITIIIILFLSIQLPTNAQAPYTGGKGDGYDMGETAVTTEQDQPSTSPGGIQISPNPLPSGAFLQITADNLDTAPLTVNIYDLIGKRVYQQKWSDPSNRFYLKLQLHAGVYVVHVVADRQTYSRKLIILR